MGPSWLLAAALGSGLSADFRIETDSPDALCPELGMTRTAVAQRLGELDVETGANWHGRYTVVHDPEGRRGDYIRLTVYEGENSRLVRDLPMASESCATLAMAIAIVIEGFFRDISQDRLRDAPASNDPPKDEHSEVAPASNAKVEKASRDVSREEKPTSGPQQEPSPSTDMGPILGVTAGLAYETMPAGFGADFGLLGAITPHLGWRAQLGVPFNERVQKVTPGEANLKAFPLRLSLPYHFGAKQASLFFGPSLLFSIERASSRGLESEVPKTRVATGLGVRVGGEFWPSRWFGLSVSSSLEGVVSRGATFTVGGRKVLDLSRIRAAFYFELMTTVFP